MIIEIKAPTFPESVQEGSIATWHKQPGEAVERDELLVDIETDKVVLEVLSPTTGTVREVVKVEGDTVLSGEVIARIQAGEGAVDVASVDNDAGDAAGVTDAEDSAAPIASPAARKIADQRGIDLASVSGSGRDGRITKEDVTNYQPAAAAASTAPRPADNVEKPPSAPSSTAAAIPVALDVAGERVEKRVPMTRMRARIAERLLQVTQNTAMLTTFNEVDMHRIIELRNEFKEQFSKMHNGTRLGFMSFFVRASVEALKRFPLVNASIDGSDVVYHGYQDVGVAVSTDRGLVVPVLRDADQMSLAEVESKIAEFGARARDNKLTIEEMIGGTFTITNGGVYGSLLSTPILNPPQTAILGMHTIKERPIAEQGVVVIRPMMNLALSYDHRLVDGRDAVLFLLAIKEMIENPAKILLEI